MKTDMSRRAFSGNLGAALMMSAAPAAAIGAAAAKPTAGEIIARIKAKLAGEGIAWQAKSIDTIKIGSPDTPVTGIATTFQASLEVLQQAAAAKTNLIISHERLFWDFVDEVGPLADDAPYYRVAGSPEADPILTAKRRFCEEHKLVVWRFHDHWHTHKPDPIFEGFTAQLGWQRYFTHDGPSANDLAYMLPATPLRAVAKYISTRLGTRDVRVIGDPDGLIKHVAATAHNLREMHPALLRADAVLVGETEEFDVFHYVRDAISLGVPAPKALIVISHERLEEAGMQLAADWIRPLVRDLPVRFISAGNPYWVLPEKA